jgi:ribosome recycling factor
MRKIRDLQDELLSSERQNENLREELRTVRASLSHFEDIIVPKYEQHTEITRENEIQLKALLSKTSAERDST